MIKRIRRKLVRFPLFICKIERDFKNKDRMSDIIKAVREVMNAQGTQSMNVGEIIRKIQKSHLSAVRVEKDELMEVLNYYKKLQVVFLDSEENVIFL